MNLRDGFPIARRCAFQGSSLPWRGLSVMTWPSSRASRACSAHSSLVAQKRLLLRREPVSVIRLQISLLGAFSPLETTSLRGSGGVS